MIVVVAVFDMAPADRAQFVADRTAQVEFSRSEAGCVDYALNLDAFDPGRVRLVEQWVDADALAAHMTAIRARGGPPAGVTVTGRRVTVFDGEITSET